MLGSNIIDGRGPVNEVAAKTRFNGKNKADNLRSKRQEALGMRLPALVVEIVKATRLLVMFKIYRMVFFEMLILIKSNLDNFVITLCIF